MRSALAQRPWKGAVVVARYETRERARACRSSGRACGRLRASEAGRDAALPARARALAALSWSERRRRAGACRSSWCGSSRRTCAAASSSMAWCIWNALAADTTSSARFPASAEDSAPRASAGGCPTSLRTWWTRCCRRCRSASGSARCRGACATRWRTTVGCARPCSTRSSGRSAVAALAGQAAARALERGGRPRRRGDLHPARRQRAAAQPHFHTIALDGAYVRDAEGELVFHALPEPSSEEVAEVAEWTHAGLVRVFARHGRSLDGVEDAPASRTAASAEPTPVAVVVEASVRGRHRSLPGARLWRPHAPRRDRHRPR